MEQEEAEIAEILIKSEHDGSDITSALRIATTSVALVLGAKDGTIYALNQLLGYSPIYQNLEIIANSTIATLTGLLIAFFDARAGRYQQLPRDIVMPTFGYISGFMVGYGGTNLLLYLALRERRHDLPQV